MLVATAMLDERCTIMKTHFLSVDIFAECDGLRVGAHAPSGAAAVVGGQGWIATMPRDDARAFFHADRTRWAFSAGSHRADVRVDLPLMRDNLGHVSLTTTSQYLHADDDWRQSATEAKHRPGW